MLYLSRATLGKLGHFISFLQSFLGSNHLSVTLDISTFQFSHVQLVSASPYLILISIPRGQKYSITAQEHLFDLLTCSRFVCFARCQHSSWILTSSSPRVQYYRYQAIHLGLAIILCISFFGIRYLYLSLPTWLSIFFDIMCSQIDHTLVKEGKI